MSGLIVPKHVAKARAAAVADVQSKYDPPMHVQTGNRVLAKLDTVFPTDLDPSRGFDFLVAPLQIQNKTAGGIYLSDQTLDDMEWIQGIGRVVLVSPCAYKGVRWRDMEFDPETMGVKLGDLCRFNARTPERFWFDNFLILSINDDAIRGPIKPQNAHRYRFER